MTAIYALLRERDLLRHAEPSQGRPVARFNAEAVQRHIRKKHPGCPDFAVAYFVGEIVGRDWHGASIGKAVGITMQTPLRHTMTDYD